MLRYKVRWLTVFFMALALLLAACGGGTDPVSEEIPEPTEAASSEEEAPEPTEAASSEEEAPEPTEAASSEEAAPEPTEAASSEETAASNECLGITVEEGAMIVFSGWGDGAEQEIYRDSISRFSEVCPNITVDYQPVPADFQTQMKAAFSGGEGPDVLYVDDGLMTALGRRGQLQSLDPYMDEAGVTRDEFIQPLLSIFTLDKETFALPKEWGTLGLVYLPAAFQEAGIDEPTADWTWEDLREAAVAINESSDYEGFCQNADWARFAPWAFSHGGSYTDESATTATLNEQAILDAAGKLVQMQQEGSLVTASTVGAGWCGEAIGKELVGMTLEGGWMVNFMNNEYAEVDWKAVPVPAGSEGKADIIFTNGIGVNAATENPNAAAAFAIFVTGRANQAAITETGFAYPTRSSQLDLIQNENDAAIAEGGTYDLTRVANWGPNTGRVNDAVSQALERLYLGEQDVAEAFEQAQEEAQLTLDEGVSIEASDLAPIEEASDSASAAIGNECLGIEDEVTVVFSGWGDGAEQEIYRDSIERFSEVCPNITIDYQPVPADFQTQMKAAFSGGEGPDVLYINDGLMTALGRTGQLQSLDPYMDKAGVTRDEFIQPLLSIFTIDKETFALPKDWDTLGLVYLPAAFEEAGIDEPTADWTWEDLRTAAVAISENSDYEGFCQNADWARFAPWAFSHGGSYTDETATATTLNEQSILDAAGKLVEMQQEGSLVTASDVGAGWCGEAIGKELVGMTLEGSSMVNFMNNEYAEVDWKAVPVPAGPEGKADIIFTNGIGVNAATENPNAAAAFAIFVTGRANQAAITETGFAYPTRFSQLDLIQNENDAAIAEGGTYDLTRVANWGPNTERINDAVSQALERLYLGEQDVAEAFEQAQEEAQLALDGAE